MLHAEKLVTGAHVVQSAVVPTEYDVWHEHGRWVVMDDRSRRFTSRSKHRALAKAERAQDPQDPIHQPPYPSPADLTA